MNKSERPRRNEKVGQIIDYALFLVAPLFVIAVWQVLGDGGHLNLSILPTPQKIMETMVSYAKSGLLSEHFASSFSRVGAGFLLGGLTGLIFGTLLGLSPWFNRLSAVILGVLRPIPMVGLVPLFILWFGIGEKSKILVIAVGALWPVLLNTEQGIRSTDSKYLEVARLLKKDRFTILRRIIFPAAVPELVTGFRLGLSTAWRGVVAAEMIGATRGVGYIISYGREMSLPAAMFLGLLTIGVVGILIDILLARLQNKIIKWA
jgi:sulfonate transport system permease protein